MVAVNTFVDDHLVRWLSENARRGAVWSLATTVISCKNVSFADGRNVPYATIGVTDDVPIATAFSAVLMTMPVGRKTRRAAIIVQSAFARLAQAVPIRVPTNVLCASLVANWKRAAICRMVFALDALKTSSIARNARKSFVETTTRVEQ